MSRTTVPLTSVRRKSRPLPSLEPERLARAGLLTQGRATFTNLAEHILSTPPQNTFLDAFVTNGSQFFYRLKVE